MKFTKILVIDDEKLIRWSLEKQLKSLGYIVFVAETGEEGLSIYEKNLPDIVFIDNKLPGIQGLDLIPKLKSLWSESVIIFMTAYGAIDTAVSAMKYGASEYMSKPFSSKDVNAILLNICEKYEDKKEQKNIKRYQNDKVTFDNIVGRSLALRQIIQTAKKIAHTEATTVLILGESGTGKDLFAKAIHNESSRKNKPFVTINCAVLPGTLLESELFGHEKGAFTDAKSMKKGLFEIAEGGTVFLDEIGEIDHSTQVKLLGILENRKIRRVGGTTDIPVEIRIIAATNKNLKKAIELKDFREDLYYRLQVFQIDLPPLREHKEDIPELSDYFIEMFNEQFRKKISGIELFAIEILVKYNWPGNTRELRNVIERAFILETGNLLQVDSLPSELLRLNIDKVLHPNLLGSFSSDVSLYDLEKQTLIQALHLAEGNQSKAARLLGISRDTLRYRMKKYHL